MQPGSTKLTAQHIDDDDDIDDGEQDAGDEDVDGDGDDDDDDDSSHDSHHDGGLIWKRLLHRRLFSLDLFSPPQTSTNLPRPSNSSAPPAKRLATLALRPGSTDWVQGVLFAGLAP